MPIDMPIDITGFMLFGILFIVCIFDHIQKRRKK